MIQITSQEANRVVAYTLGFPMVYADLLEHTNVEYEIIGE